MSKLGKWTGGREKEKREGKEEEMERGE